MCTQLTSFTLSWYHYHHRCMQSLPMCHFIDGDCLQSLELLQDRRRALHAKASWGLGLITSLLVYSSPLLLVHLSTCLLVDLPTRLQLSAVVCNCFLISVLSCLLVSAVSLVSCTCLRVCRCVLCLKKGPRCRCLILETSSIDSESLTASPQNTSIQLDFAQTILRR